MKCMLLAICTFILFGASAQFHVRVEANPDNHGEVNSEWKNNYVVTYTTDNWQTKDIIKAQAIYETFDGVTAESIYQPAVFQTKNAAIAFAKRFVSVEVINRYEKVQRQASNQLQASLKKNQKKLPPEPANERPNPVAIY